MVDESTSNQQNLQQVRGSNERAWRKVMGMLQVEVGQS